MIDKLKELIAEAEAFSAQSKEEIEAFRIKYLGSKGLLKQYFAEFKNVANEQKKEFGQTINQLKKIAEDKVTVLKDALEKNKMQKDVAKFIKTKLDEDPDLNELPGLYLN